MQLHIITHKKTYRGGGAMGSNVLQRIRPCAVLTSAAFAVSFCSHKFLFYGFYAIKKLYV